jgi:hypothetical protein
MADLLLSVGGEYLEVFIRHPLWVFYAFPVMCALHAWRLISIYCGGVR